MKLSLALSAAALVHSALLQDYCTLLESKCYSALQVNASTCAMGMANIPEGNDQTDSNTLNCRMQYLNGSSVNCRYAAPSGGGRCGAVLDAVCSVATTVCNNVTGYTASYNDTASCVAGLTAASLQFQWGSLQGVAASSDNSLECRAYHALASVTAGGVHCTHFGANSPTCTAPIVPDKQHYCDVLQYNCNNSTTLQYADMTQCLAVAQNFITSYNSSSMMTAADSASSTTATNSLGCREYHAQASKSNAAVHCQHAGPSGGGVCGTYPSSWAIMAAASPCNDTSVGSLISQIGENLVNMAVPIGDTSNGQTYSKYLDTTNNTQFCRIYHLGVATGAPEHCVHGAIHGGATCGGDYITNLCTFIGGICGFGTSAWQYTSSAACIAGLNNVTTNSLGSPTNFANNTLACRFYHAGVAGSYISSNSSLFQLHCGHVLAPSTPGGCIAGSTAPTPAMSNNTSGASAFSTVVSVVVMVASFLCL